MLPETVKDHDKLITLGADAPVYKDILVPGVDVQPQFLDPNNGTWVLRVWFHPGVKLPTHYHTGTVHLWTLSGKWYYSEHKDQPQTAGCYLYEPGGSVHSFETPEDNAELTDTIMMVQGANINFDADGNYMGTMDANSIIGMIEEAIRERGLEPSIYIKANFPNYSKNVNF
ncbi:2,4'-dihydroxyacetophenone dioxygenase family protein [uncultured Marinobacter sp.]|uniref:2,4'-dihydroxyacetophenone dioxygenase family protein n=1 Tax=uncultured Marinobacter sp. TaxID=187379 RepID=UPI0030DA9E24|tara:strand:+ start:2847 stop:3359 length:513 start_codon:yes stop_codon:yes gene_type:complete